MFLENCGYWSTRALAQSCQRETISPEELLDLRWEHLHLGLYRLAKAIKEVMLAFFEGIQGGVLAVPSGVLMVELFSCLGCGSALPPGLLEAFIKGLLSDPQKMFVSTVLVITVSGVIGGAREAFAAACVELKEVWIHVKWVWDPHTQAKLAYKEVPSTLVQRIESAVLRPFETAYAITANGLSGAFNALELVLPSG